MTVVRDVKLHIELKMYHLNNRLLAYEILMQQKFYTEYR